MRVVPDTNIVVSGLLWNDPPRRLLDAAGNGEIELFTSAALLKELSGVLARDKFSPLLAAKATTPNLLIRHYGLLARLTTPRPIPRASRDSKDDIVIATAIAAQAHIIATGDKDLLTLNSHSGIPIVDAATALRRV